MLRNTTRQYGAITIVLHWLAAAAVLAMLGTALMMALAPDRENYIFWVKLHSSIGIMASAILLPRIVWHFIDRQPTKLSDNRALRTVAGIVHVALLLLIALQLITGPVDVWSGGFPLTVFDAFVVPNPVGKALDDWHDALGDFHRVTGIVIAVLVSVHLLGVAKHVLIDRDGTLGRMIGREAIGRS